MSRHLRPKNLLFVVNPISGGTDKSALPAQIEAFCRRNNIAHSILHLEKEGSERVIERHIREHDLSAVIACGGDGTVNFVGKLLIDTAMPLGIIPLGSSNALAKNLHIPLLLEQALQALYEYNTKNIDTLTINGRCCLHICDLGFNANLITRFSRRKWRGMASYALGLLQELFTFRFFPYSVETGKEKVEGKAFSITITNAKIYGTQAAINPKGKINDGKFEICIIKPFPGLALLKMSWQLFNRRLNYSRYSIYIRAKEAILHNPGGESMHIDGELVEKQEKVEIKVVPSSLHIIVPKNVS